MAIASGPPRTDLPFLRRRVKPVEVSVALATVPAAAPAPAPAPAASASLDLGRPQSATTPTPAGPTAARAASSSGAVHPDRPSAGAESVNSARPTRPTPRQPFPAPTIRDVTALDARTPMVRLNARQSAVGSLVITGATSVVFESITRLTGSATALGAVPGEHAGAQVSTAGNRPLVGFHEGAALVTLRHVRELHRALVIGRDARVLGLRLPDGVTLTVSPWADGDLAAVSLLSVDGLLELRAERVPADWTDEIVHREFGFTLTPQVEFPRGSRENE